MKPEEISFMRLHAQQVAATEFTSPRGLVGWMGAMQAQDFNMAQWAVSARLKGISQKEVQVAFDKGDILRTHVLRPTWHFVSPEDIYPLLALSAPRIRSSVNGRNKQLGLTKEVFAKCNRLIEKCFKKQSCITRNALMQMLSENGIPLHENRASHIFLHAELDGILCSGRIQNGRPTYALLSERVKKVKKFSKEEGLALLAKKYFQSHGPATVADFAWWSGLSLTEARQGLDAIKKHLIAEKINEQVYWFTEELLPISKTTKSSLYLLPAFDEFLISYTDRSAMIAAEHSDKTFSANGIFRPVIVIKGKVRGLWKKEIVKRRVVVKAELFDPKERIPAAALRRELRKLESFSGDKVGWEIFS